MIKAVFFDMDDTLLRINLSPFLMSYYQRMSKLIASIAEKSWIPILNDLTQSLFEVSNENRTDEYTNAELLVRAFKERTDIPLDDPVIADALHFFDQYMVDKLNTSLINAYPRPGAHAALGRVKDLGLRCVLATNPSFSEACIRTRMRWAGIDTFAFDYITYLENSYRMKPCKRYYEDIAHTLSLELDECVMVGNDPFADFCSPAAGIQTIYVGKGQPKQAVWCGDMRDLENELEGIITKLDKQS